MSDFMYEGFLDMVQGGPVELFQMTSAKAKWTPTLAQIMISQKSGCADGHSTASQSLNLAFHKLSLRLGGRNVCCSSFLIVARVLGRIRTTRATATMRSIKVFVLRACKASCFCVFSGIGFFWGQVLNANQATFASLEPCCFPALAFCDAADTKDL